MSLETISKRKLTFLHLFFLFPFKLFLNEKLWLQMKEIAWLYHLFKDQLQDGPIEKKNEMHFNLIRNASSYAIFDLKESFK